MQGRSKAAKKADGRYVKTAAGDMNQHKVLNSAKIAKPIVIGAIRPGPS